MDPLVTGCMMNALLRNADRVKIACLAQLVNVIAPIMTEPGGRSWVQTIYYPFLLASRYGRGDSLAVEVDVPSYDCAIRKAVPCLDCAAVSGRDGSLNLFLVNRAEEGMEVELELPGPFRSAEHTALRGTTLVTEACAMTEGSVCASLPARSWSMLRVIK